MLKVVIPILIVLVAILVNYRKEINFVLNNSPTTTSPHKSWDELKEGIAYLYDKSTGIWLDVWGDDLHHGFYKTAEAKDHKAAQVEMIEQALHFGYNGSNIDLTNKSLLDVGCGVGGSSRHIIKKYGGSGEGITLSTFQVNSAKSLTEAAGLSNKLHFRIADAMQMPYANSTFDLTWSMESGEHMPNKKAFLHELFRVTNKGGRIIIVTWCHRELLSTEQSLPPSDLQLLHRISNSFYLPEWVPASHYVSVATSLGLEDVRMADWTENIAPFWSAVIESALQPRTFVKMLFSGSTSTLQSAYTGLWMRQSVNKGLIRLVIITAQKKVN